MKFRSRVRIAAADRGSRAGNAGSAGLARPGTADPAARAGHPGFPQATVRTHKRQGRFPSRRVIARRVLKVFVIMVGAAAARDGVWREGWMLLVV